MKYERLVKTRENIRGLWQRRAPLPEARTARRWSSRWLRCAAWRCLRASRLVARATCQSLQGKQFLCTRATYQTARYPRCTRTVSLRVELIGLPDSVPLTGRHEQSRPGYPRRWADQRAADLPGARLLRRLRRAQAPGEEARAAEPRRRALPPELCREPDARRFVGPHLSMRHVQSALASHRIADPVVCRHMKTNALNTRLAALDRT